MQKVNYFKKAKDKKGTNGFIDANRYNERSFENPRLTFVTVLLEGNKGSVPLYKNGTITIQLLDEKETKHDYKFENKNFSGDCVYYIQKHFVNQLPTDEPFETDVEQYLENIRMLEKV